MHVAQRFELFLDTYRRPDWSRWTGQTLDEATGGVVTRSCVTNLRKGRIENPGWEKMLTIARAMGFPPALWFEDAPRDGTQLASEQGQDLAGRVGHLFKTIVDPGTGEPYTDADVARMSAGVLTEGEVEGIRTGKISDPTVSQVAALAAVFGVAPSYLVDRARGSRSLMVRSWKPWPTRPPQRYSGRAHACWRGRRGSYSGWCENSGGRVRHDLRRTGQKTAQLR